jgi:hypothetical protein
MTAERMSAFQYTNAYFATKFVAIYAQEHKAALINYSGITGGITLDVYITMIFCWLALVILFGLIDNVRPSHDPTFTWWNIGTAVMPCYSCHAPELQHFNSLVRSVAIITTSIFVLLCTTYYQTLLLSNTCVRPMFGKKGI